MIVFYYCSSNYQFVFVVNDSISVLRLCDLFGFLIFQTIIVTHNNDDGDYGNAYKYGIRNYYSCNRL